MWLNFAEDHLDWHPSMAEYAAAKERIWANQGPGDTAVANADDQVVMAAAARATAAVVTFGRDGDYRVVDGVKLPFVVKMTQGGETSTVTYSEIKHNVPVSDSEFAAPKAASAPPPQGK